MSQAQYLEIVSGFSDGIIDQFGNGTADGAYAGFYAIPSSLSGVITSGWYVTQWGQTATVDPSIYTTNAPSTYDDIYGNSLYSWATPGATAGMQIYQNTASLGGGYVIQLDDGSAEDSIINEQDMNISASNIPFANASLKNTITISLNEKILQAINTFVDSTTLAPIFGGQTIISNSGLGFTINFNGADGIGARAGFVQIQTWNSSKAGNAYYNNCSNNMFISTYLLGSDPYLSLLPSDKNSVPDTLTYNLNKYVYTTIYSIYSNDSSLTSAQKAAILNLSNWTVGSMYLGPATDNFPTSASSINESIKQENSAIVQISNLNVVGDQNEIYNPLAPVASVPIVDVNLKIAFTDSTFGIVQYGSVDGGSYTGGNAANLTATNVKNEYIYDGYDNISLIAPTGQNWYFGGGHGQTMLTAAAGSNIFLASHGGSTMNGGTGNDNFIIYSPTIGFNNVTDTLNNFHPGDTITLIGVGGSGWSYNWKPIYGSLGTNFTQIVSMELTITNATELVENVIFNNTTLNDLYHLTMTQNNNTSNLTITSTDAGSGPMIMVNDLTSGQNGYLPGTSSGLANQFGQVTEANWINVTAPTNIQSKYIYSGSDNIICTATAGENWEFGGGVGSDVLIASGGNNIFIAGDSASFMAGGDGNDQFNIPDADITGQTSWDVISNFHFNDSVNLLGVAGSGWTYSWYNSLGVTGYQGATLYATSTENDNLHVLLTFSGLSLSDIAAMSVTSNASTGTLTITDTESADPPYLFAVNPLTGDESIMASQSDSIPGVNNVFMYTGLSAMKFIAPSDQGSWEFGGGLSQTALSATTGNNILVASSGGSLMTGGSGNNQFIIPNATTTGKATWDVISDMHNGDSVIIAGLSSTDWLSSFALKNMGESNLQGLTFEAENKSNGGLMELVTFSNLQSNQSSLLSIMPGIGSQVGDLVITIK